MLCRCPAIHEIAGMLDAMPRKPAVSNLTADERQAVAVRFVREAMAAVGRPIGEEEARRLILDAAAIGMVGKLQGLDAVDLVLQMLGGYLIRVVPFEEGLRQRGMVEPEPAPAIAKPKAAKKPKKTANQGPLFR